MKAFGLVLLCAITIGFAGCVNILTPDTATPSHFVASLPLDHFTQLALKSPRGLAIDAAGNLFVSDFDAAVVYRITPAGHITSLGNKASGAADEDVLEFPSGLAVDSRGNLYVTDSGRNVISKITPAGKIYTVHNIPPSPPAGLILPADFQASDWDTIHTPTGVVVDPSGVVFVTNSRNSNIGALDLGDFPNPPYGFALLAGEPRQYGHTDGYGVISDGESIPHARFATPHGIAIDTAGNLYVADDGNSNIRKITLVRVEEKKGNTHVFNFSIRKATVTTLAGHAGEWGSHDGDGTAATFAGPCGLAVDATGNVFVADTGNNTIRKITPRGHTTTFAGLAGQSGRADGTGTGARFASPRAIAIDAAGNLYVADTDNALIRRITPTGAVTTIAGSSTR